MLDTARLAGRLRALAAQAEAVAAALPEWVGPKTHDEIEPRLKRAESAMQRIAAQASVGFKPLEKPWP